MIVVCAVIGAASIFVSLRQTNLMAFQYIGAVFLFFAFGIIPLVGHFVKYFDLKISFERTAAQKAVEALTYKLDCAVSVIRPDHVVDVPPQFASRHHAKSKKIDEQDPVVGPLKNWLLAVGLPLGLVCALIASAFLCRRETITLQASAGSFRTYFSSFVALSAGVYGLWSVTFPSKAVKASDKFMGSMMQADRFWKYMIADEPAIKNVTKKLTFKEILMMVHNDPTIIAPISVKKQAAISYLEEVTLRGVEDLDEDKTKLFAKQLRVAPSMVRLTREFLTFDKIASLLQSDEHNFDFDVLLARMLAFSEKPFFVPYQAEEVRSMTRFLSAAKGLMSATQVSQYTHALDKFFKANKDYVQQEIDLYQTQFGYDIKFNSGFNSEKGKEKDELSVEEILTILMVYHGDLVNRPKVKVENTSPMANLSIFCIAIGDEHERVVALTPNDALKIYSCSGDCKLSPTNIDLMTHSLKIVKQKYFSAEAMSSYVPTLLILLVISAIVWNGYDFFKSGEVRPQVPKKRKEAKTKGQNIKNAQDKREKLEFDSEETKEHWNRITSRRGALRLALQDAEDYYQDVVSHGSEFQAHIAGLDVASLKGAIERIDVEVEKLYNGDYDGAFKVGRKGKGKNKQREADESPVKGCIHVKDCPRVLNGTIATDWKVPCNSTCGGHHCTHFAECVPTISETGPAQIQTAVNAIGATMAKMDAPQMEAVEIRFASKKRQGREQKVSRKANPKTTLLTPDKAKLTREEQETLSEIWEQQQIKSKAKVERQLQEAQEAKKARKEKSTSEALSLIPQRNATSPFHRGVVPIFSKNGDAKTKFWSCMTKTSRVVDGKKECVFAMKKHSLNADAYVMIQEKEFALPPVKEWTKIGVDTICIDSSRIGIPNVKALGPMREVTTDDEMGMTMFSYEPGTLEPVIVSGQCHKNKECIEHLCTTYNFQCGSPYVDGSNHVIALHSGAKGKTCNFGDVFDLKASAKQ